MQNNGRNAAMGSKWLTLNLTKSIAGMWQCEGTHQYTNILYCFPLVSSFSVFCSTSFDISVRAEFLQNSCKKCDTVQPTVHQANSERQHLVILNMEHQGACPYGSVACHVLPWKTMCWSPRSALSLTLHQHGDCFSSVGGRETWETFETFNT